MKKDSLIRRIFGKERPFIHPNEITAIGGVTTVLGGALILVPYANLASPVIASVGYLGDKIDGDVAREYEITTIEGKKLDPLMDKIRNFAIGTYILYDNTLENVLLSSAIIANFALDTYSQKQRGNLIPQFKEAYKAIIHPEQCRIERSEDNPSISANIFGKVKTGVQAGANITYLVKEAYVDFLQEIIPYAPEISDGAEKAITGAFTVSLICGGIGIVKRIRASREST